MNTYDYIETVEIEATSYQKIACFGFGLAFFAQEHPEVDFVWHEVEDGSIYGKGTFGVVFVIHFQTEAARDLYRASRDEEVEDDVETEVENPIAEIMTRLRLTSLH